MLGTGATAGPTAVFRRPAAGQFRIPGSASADLLLPVLQRLSILAALSAYVWFISRFAVYFRDPAWPSALAPSVFFTAALSALIGRWTYRVRALVLAAGMTAAVLAEVALGDTPTAQWAAFATTLATGMLLGPAGSLSATGVICIISLVLPGAEVQAWPVSRMALLGAAAAWAAGSSVLESLFQAEDSEMRAWHHAHEAMAQRGDLEQANKAMRDMYALLERTNHELETARREADEARQVKARFAANISHELRTPLNLVLGFSRVMYQSPHVYAGVRWTPELQLDIHEIYRASRHLVSMIDDILDLSRVDAQKVPIRLEPAAMASLIGEATDIARGLMRDSAVALRVDVADDLPQVLVDRARVRQVLLNLLNNAIRFTDKGEIRVSAAVVGGEVEVAVTDTGSGIDAEDLPTVFDEFSQARGPLASGGAGLGLAVCKQLVQLHGGRISAESELGTGSTFRFTVPVPGSGRARSRLAFYSPEGWTPPLPHNRLGDAVIVVGPDERSASLVARGIEGYRAIPISDAASLPALVEAEHPAGVVLVRDPLMPQEEGVRPEDVWATSGRPDLGVIECEVPFDNLARRYLQVDAYLTKPVEAEVLLAAIGPGVERILVLDDDAGFRSLLKRIISAGLPSASVRGCAKGEEALVLLLRQRFDVLLLDLVMPGLGGVEFLQLARQSSLLAGTKVIVTSGAPYVEELATIFPTQLRFSKREPPRGAAWLQCIKALLDASPPDYARPALSPGLSSSL